MSKGQDNQLARAIGGRKLLRALRRQGATIEFSRSGHLRISKPGHMPIFGGSTPSDNRARANLYSTLRQHGYIEDVHV